MVRGTFSPARAWRPAVVARLARTLGRTIRLFALARRVEVQVRNTTSPVNRREGAMRTALVSSSLLIAFMASAADNWTAVGKAEPPLSAILVNLGSVVMNGNGNRVSTIRSQTGSYRMDTVTEFDCSNRRTRALASSLTDGAGRLVSATGEGKFWFNEKQSIGIEAVCTATLTQQ